MHVGVVVRDATVDSFGSSEMYGRSDNGWECSIGSNMLLLDPPFLTLNGELRLEEQLSRPVRLRTNSPDAPSWQ